MTSSPPLSDFPVTAVQCTSDGVVYFATGNAVWRNRLATSDSSAASSLAAATLPLSNTERCAHAPDSTVITSLAIAHYRLPSSEGATGQRVSDDGDGEELTIVLIAAADRLLAQLAPPSGAHHKNNGHSATASSSSCRCVLRAAASRLLRVTIDAARQTVVVLTASNDVFLLHLDRVVVALRSAAATLPLYADLSQEVPHTCLRGPPLGVVLAADILVENGRSGEDEAVHPVHRFFAATYSGEVVEWCPSLADTRSGDLHQVKWSVVSRVQAHPRGCAVFAVRVEHTAAPRSVCGETGSRAPQRTHLVTCSDDRTVALYERLSLLASSTPASLVAGSEWVLLWRGGGTAFAKSRIFDAALCSVWSAEKVSPSTSLSSADVATCWSCAVQVAAAGEDGCVQVVCVRRTGPLENPRNDQSGNVSAVTNVAVTPCLVRARQHRGHGAYRVCFCRSADGHMTLVSGGFDGAVFAHTYALTGQDEVSAATGGNLSSLFDTSAAVAVETAVTSSPREAPESHRRRSSSKAAQVRVVHVDAAGRLIACTSEMLCAQPQRGSGTSHCDTPPHYWNTPLPNTLSGDAGADDADVGGSFCSRCCFVSDASCFNGACGLPTCAESFDVSFSADDRKKAAGNGDGSRLSVSFAVVATTTGVLYVVPYACSGAAFLGDSGSAVRCVHPTQPRTTCATRWSPCAATPALQKHGKITHIACLAVAGAGNSAAETHTLFVATSHVQNAVVLSTLSFSRGASNTISSDGASEQIVSEWRCVSVWGSCPGPFTTALFLISTNAAAAAPVSFWLLVGDRDGCVRGEHHVVTSATSLDAASRKSGFLSTTSVASVVEYVFPESQHVAVAAFCLEETSTSLRVDREPERVSSTLLETAVLRVAGTGGVLALLCLPTKKTAHETSEKSVPHPARCREPLRLPFDVSAVLAISPRVCVTQCGTTVSVFYRIPGRTSWVLVNAYEDIRAPRLLTARIHEEGIATRSGGAAQRLCPCVTLAHCSDGHTVESFMSFPNQPAREPNSVSCVQTALLHGSGLPGKDYNCVAYAPPPLDSLLMGCEDSSLVAVAAPSTYPLRPQSLFSRLTAPMNICGAHHSNILAIAVLPPPDETAAAAAAACVDRAVRFVSVGGGAMVNLWSSDATTSPLRLVDWWCGGGSGVNESGVGGGVDAPLATALEKDCSGVQSSAVQQQQPQPQRQSNARFQKRRVKQAAASPSSSSSAALAERIARFLCVAAVDSHTFAVGSSDGTLLIFRVLDDATQPNARSEVHLEWQGALNAELPKPVLSVSATAPATSAAVGAAKAFVVPPLLVAGDTNGLIYVVEATTRRVVAQRRLEQSSVNALSEVHVLPADAPLGDGQQTRHLTLRFAAAHDSGNVHLLHIDLRSSSDAVLLVQLTVLGSASTGVTAGRSVRWPHLSQPIVAVSEERVTYFNAHAERGGFLAVIAERRVNVRCVSGAAVVAPDAPEEGNGDVDCITHYPQVAIVGQGFEVV